MGAEADQRRFLLDRARSAQDVLPAVRLVPELRHQPAGPLDAEQTLEPKSRLLDLGRKLVRMVEVRGREPLEAVGRVAVLTIREVSVDDRAERRIGEEALAQTVEEGRKARDRGRGDRPAGSDDAPRFGESRDSLLALGQVVERTEQQDGVVRGVHLVEAPRVPDRDAEWTLGSLCHFRRLPDVQGNGIDEVDAITARGEPGRVDAGSAAHVEHGRGRRWKKTLEELLRPRELEGRAGGQPRALHAVLVVLEDRLVQFRHAATLSVTPTRGAALSRAIVLSAAGLRRRGRLWAARNVVTTSHSGQRVRSLEEAAAFVVHVGIALVYPSADLVLPSLWEAVAGPEPVRWSVRDGEGKFVSFTPEFDAVWRWKDELPKRRLACVGRHLARLVTVLSPVLVPAVYALTGRSGRPDDFRESELAPLQREVAEAVLEHGPCDGPELRELLGTAEKRRVDAAVEALQRSLVVTNVGVAEQEHGWPAIKLDILARHWSTQLCRLPAAEDAETQLAERVLQAGGEVSAADVAAALGWPRKRAAAALETLTKRGVATVREEGGFALWTPAKTRRPVAETREGD